MSSSCTPQNSASCAAAESLVGDCVPLGINSTKPRTARRTGQYVATLACERQAVAHQARRPSTRNDCRFNLFVEPPVDSNSPPRRQRPIPHPSSEGHLEVRVKDIAIAAHRVTPAEVFAGQLVRDPGSDEQLSVRGSDSASSARASTRGTTTGIKSQRLKVQEPSRGTIWRKHWPASSACPPSLCRRLTSMEARSSGGGSPGAKTGNCDT